jgi:hypothetical protein
MILSRYDYYQSVAVCDRQGAFKSLDKKAVPSIQGFTTV